MNEREIFLAALQKPDAVARAAFLDEACTGPDIRRQIDALLVEHDKLGSFLEAPAAELPSPAGFGPTVDAPIREAPGTVIGPYKLLEQIGEGGMGTVWMAQQTEPVKRVVAVKLIKAGMDSKQIIARFEAERQALALMDHANIARVLDAGTTSAGRPYFVMDLVKGVPITKYCDEHKLTPRQRLELFIPVCQAVQHAHQKGIIHRDLKPSNVLVALYDGKPVPKVIDFGVAKAAGQPLTEKTLVTGFGNIVGTLEYMSPEQAEVNQLDIDTRSDIYSLGVLLYELLTGSPPFTRKELEKAGMLEMLRVIREQEPSKPSTKLSTADGLPTLAANRGTEPAKLTRLVRGELDWIVMKALEKDRNRRYETANGFAMDVQRYLADEPVLACPPSVGYRLGKFARRNKLGLAMAGMILFFLVLLGSGIGWVLRDREAREQELARQREARQLKLAGEMQLALDRAELFQREGKRAEALAAYERAELLVGEAREDEALVARLAALKERLDAEAQDRDFITRFDEILLEQGQVNEQGRFVVRSSYPKLKELLQRYGIELEVTPRASVAARIQARPESVQRHVFAALYECLQQAPARNPSRQWLTATLDTVDTDLWRKQVRQAWAARDWATVMNLGRNVDVHTQPPTFLCWVARVRAEKEEGASVELMRQVQEAGLELLRRVQRAYPGDFWANHHLADHLGYAYRHGEAVRYYTAALALRPDNPYVYVSRGLALGFAGERDAAIADMRQAIVLAPRYANAYFMLAGQLLAKNDRDGAIAAYRQTIALDGKDLWAHYQLGLHLYKKGDLEGAIPAFRAQARLNPKQWTLVRGWISLAGALTEQAWRLALAPERKPHEVKWALELSREAVDLSPTNNRCWLALGAAEYRAGNWHAALDALQKAQKYATEDSARSFFQSMALARLNRKREARVRYDAGVRWRFALKVSDEELRRLAAEAAALLGLKVPVTLRQPLQLKPGPSLLTPRDRETLANGARHGNRGFVWDFDWADVPGATRYHLVVTMEGVVHPIVSAFPTSSF